jgi:hypothetical protein
MADLWDYRQRWRRRWRRLRQQGQDRLQAWRRWWRISSKEEVSEVNMDVDTAAQEAMGKVIVAQMQQHTLQSIREAVRAELLEDVKAEAFQAAMTELDDRLQQERERFRDTFAKQKQALASELEDELERREEVLRRQVRDSYEERLLTLKDDLAPAAAARDQATALLVSLVTQLVAEKPKRYLHDVGGEPT